MSGKEISEHIYNVKVMHAVCWSLNNPLVLFLLPVVLFINLDCFGVSFLVLETSDIEIPMNIVFLILG